MTATPSVSESPQGEVRPRSLLGSLDASVRGYRGAEKQRGAPRITSSGPQGLVARTHGEHDGCCGTGIWGIPDRMEGDESREIGRICCWLFVLLLWLP